MELTHVWTNVTFTVNPYVLGMFVFALSLLYLQMTGWYGFFFIKSSYKMT